MLDYINRLDNFDGPDIALLALGFKEPLCEEAFAIYNKFHMYVEAINVLIDNLQNIPRAHDYADKIN